MKLSISGLVVSLMFIPLTAVPVIAGEISPAALGGGTRAVIIPAAFGDGPSTGPHHGRRNHAGATSKSVEPSHADLNGATRESADKAYRKQYGF